VIVTLSISLQRMLQALFHADVAPALLADVRRRMSEASPETVNRLTAPRIADRLVYG